MYNNLADWLTFLSLTIVPLTDVVSLNTVLVGTISYLILNPIINKKVLVEQAA
ncbi:hypothetical protein HGG78_12500 [Vibrio aestuarianus]|uniref:hypothetical protein n=1 Tax=Vibrio aestuarianus TaxID=28171 RepID=UPI0015596320|nr:hypothetical protein [Vibrio aestuarianus]NGZ14551.1 hypothetical protein [Vibrio aestuarianus]NKZ50699.1 hypothetical protein [Vibrio aestuarianus]